MPDDVQTAPTTPSVAPAEAPPRTDILLPTTTHLVQTIDVPIKPVVTRLVIDPKWFRDELQAS